VIRIVSACALLVVAAAVGYALSANLAGEILRRGLERRLSDLLLGEVRIGELEVTFANGLGLRGERVSAYPADGGPGLYARTVRAELREPALLLGQLALESLTLEDLEIRIELDANGNFSFPPLQWLRKNADASAADPEPALLPVAAVRDVSQVLLQELRIADRLSIERGSLHFEDRLERPAGQRPLHFQLQQIDGNLTRSWLSDRVELRLDATLIDPQGRRTPLQLRGSGAEDGGQRLSLQIEGLDLDAVDPYLSRLSRGTDLDGQLSGSLHFEAPDPLHQSVDLDWTLHELATTLQIRGESVQISLPLAEAQVRLEVEPGSVRLVRADARGPRAQLGFEATVERPLRAGSIARIESEVRGVGLADVQPVLRQLPETDLEVLRLWFQILQSGRVDRLKMSGRAALSRWAQLVRGELQTLPQGFLLEIDTSDVTALLDDGELLTDLRFNAAWSHRRLEIRDVSCLWQGEKLPTVDLTIEHPARFLESASVPLNAEVAPIPGASLLWSLLRDAPGATPREAARKLALEVDFVRHPLLRWPLEDVRLSVEPIERGTQVNLTAGRWGGVPIVGEVVYLERPRRRIAVGLEALAPEVDSGERAVLGDSRVAPGTRSDEPWAAGRFAFGADRHDPVSPAPVPYELSGDFELRGSRIESSLVHLVLAPDSTASIEFQVDLANPDELELALAARVVHARAGPIGRLLGLPDDFVTGRVDLDASLRGPVQRRQHPLSQLQGRIGLVAEDGQIAQKIPLVVAIASATDGFNPFASREVLEYESVQAELRIDHGRLEAEHFEITGPIRVYATGGIDFIEPPREIDAVVGVFLFQRARELLGMVPLVELVIPGSDKGMVGAYFHVQGPWEDPDVSTLAMKTLQEQLPDLITRPFELFKQLLTRKQPSDPKASAESVREPAPAAAGAGPP
jgi:hypothetical protein